MRRLFESILVLQDRPTGTTPMAGDQSLRLLISSAQSSAAHPFGRPLARYLGHSVARSLFRSFSRPPRSPLRSTARPLVRPLAWSRARSSPRSLSSSFDRSLVCLLANADSLACWFGFPRARSLSRLCPRARPCDRALVLGRSSPRSLACSVARSVGHSPLRLGHTVFTRTTFRGMYSERNSGTEPRQAIFLMG